MTEEAPHIKPDASPSEQTGAESRILYWTKRISYRLWRVTAELGVVIMGIAIAWLYGVSWLLSQQSVDISEARGVLGQLFAEAVAGAGVEIPTMRLDWYPATGDIVFTGQNISINTTDGTEFQNLPTLQTYFPLEEFRKGSLTPRKVVLTGGVVSWVEDENGRIRAGLGTPDTLGRLGPLWQGRRASSRQRAAIDLDGVDAVEVAGARAYYINSMNGLALSLDDVALDFQRQKEDLSFDLKAQLNQSDFKDQIPLSLSVMTNTEFDNFDVSLQAVGINPAISGPTKGRYSEIRDINAPVTSRMNFIYGPEIGLQSADLDIKVGAGRFEREDLDQTFDFESVATKAFLNLGEDEMTVERLDVAAPLLSFKSKGTLSDLDAINDGDINSSPFFDLNFENLSLDARPIFEKRLSLKGLDIAGRLDVDAQTLRMETLTLDRGTHQWVASVFLDRNEEGVFEAIRAEGALQGELSTPELLDIWPVKFADGARRWLGRSVTDGKVDTLSFKADFERQGEELVENVMDMDFTVRDGTVKYISTMTPLTQASGVAKIANNSLNFALHGGRIGGLTVLPSQVEIPMLQPKGGDMIITMNAQGGASDMLNLLGQPPFELTDKYEIDPNDVKGQGEVKLTITRPLLEYFDQSRILYDVEGEFKNVSAPSKIGTYNLTEGEISLHVDNYGLQASGPAKIGPWKTNLEWKETFDEGLTPSQYHISGDMDHNTLDEFGVGFREYFDGATKIDIRATGTEGNIRSALIEADLSATEISVGDYWSKPKGVEGRLSASLLRNGDAFDISNLVVSAPGLEIEGQIAFRSDFALKNLVFETLKVSDLVDAQLQIQPDAERELLAATLDGTLLNLSSVIDRSLSAQTSTIEAPISLEANLEELILDPKFKARNASLLYNHNGQDMTQLNLSAETEEGPVRVSLETDEVRKFRKVDVKFPRASQAASAFLSVDSIQGGKFSMTGNLPLPGEEGSFIGQAEITDFRVREAPILAQLLSLGSLTGLFNTLSGEGLVFENFVMPFHFSKGILTVREARVYGPALGMTGEGNIDLRNETVDLDGALVPAYTANSLLGDLPIIGDILVGKEGEGIFALSYQVVGPFEATQIAVNPLSALTPGFLRGIFRKKRDDMPEVEQLMDQAEEVAPTAREANEGSDDLQ